MSKKRQIKTQMNKKNKLVMIIKKIFAPLGVKGFFIVAGLALAIYCGTTLIAHADAVDDISAIYQPIIMLVKNIIFMLIAGAGYVFVTSHLLQWILVHPGWVNITTSGSNPSPLVTAGLQFTTAFADMLLIIVFLAIALGFIFKIETFQSKKALPKFFIVAILAHFAPVFVGMIIDISTVINNTLILGSQTTIVSSFDLLVSSMVQSIESLAGLIIADAAGIVMPYPIDAGVEILSIGYFLTAVLPMIPVYLSQFAVAFLIGGILMTYIIFFLSRIFILQFIAVVSPLVVVAYALPQTKHFFDTVFNELIKWTFVGTLVLFLLIIGLRSSTAIMPESTDFYTLGYGIPFMLQGYIAYYLFLFVFMSTIAYIVDRNMPQMGAQMKSSFASLGGLMMANAVKPSFNGAKQFTNRQKESMEQKAADAGGVGRMDAFSQARYGLTSIATSGMSQLDKSINKPKEGTPDYSTQVDIKGQADALNKRTNNNPLKGLNNASDWQKLGTAEMSTRLAAIANDTDKQKDLRNLIGNKAYDDALTSSDIANNIGKEAYMNNLGTASFEAFEKAASAPAIQKMFVPGLLDNEEVKKMQAAGYGENSLKQATKNLMMKGTLKALKKPEDIRKSNVGKWIDPAKDTTGQNMTAFMTQVNASTLAKSWETFSPPVINGMESWRNQRSLGYLADAAPQTIQPTGAITKLFAPHPDLADVRNRVAQREKILREQQRYRNLPLEDRETEQFNADTRTQQQWQLFNQTAEGGAENAGTGPQTGGGRRPPNTQQRN